MKKVDRVYLELSNVCNFACDFCPINHSKRKREYMDFSLLKKAVDEIAAEKITDWIAFHVLGEPLLYPRMLDAARYVKGKGLKLLITTNGALLNSRIIDSLVKLKVDKLAVSVESLGKRAHASRRSGIEFGEYYRKVLAAVSMIKQSSADMNVVLSVMNTSSKRYFDLDRDIAIDQREAGFKERLSSFIRGIYAAIGRDISRGKIAESLGRINCNRPKALLLDKQIRVYIQMFMDWGNAFTKKRVFPAKIGFCGYALNNVGVLSSGTVTICCADYDGETNLGSLKSHSLLSLLHSEKAEVVRNGFKNFKVNHPYCQRCLGAKSRIKALLKGLLTIYLFKIRSHPLQTKAVVLTGQ